MLAGAVLEYLEYAGSSPAWRVVGCLICAKGQYIDRFNNEGCHAYSHALDADDAPADCAGRGGDDDVVIGGLHRIGPTCLSYGGDIAGGVSWDTANRVEQEILSSRIEKIDRPAARKIDEFIQKVPGNQMNKFEDSDFQTPLYNMWRAAHLGLRSPHKHALVDVGHPLAELAAAHLVLTLCLCAGRGVGRRVVIPGIDMVVRLNVDFGFAIAQVFDIDDGRDKRIAKSVDHGDGVRACHGAMAHPAAASRSLWALMPAAPLNLENPMFSLSRSPLPPLSPLAI